MTPRRLPTADPAITGSIDALMVRPERVDTHACTCQDLLGTIDRHRPDDPRLAPIRDALTQPDALRSHYQPIVDLVAGEVVGFEALLRLTGPDGVVPPGELFALAAEGGWSQALDQVARRTAIEGARGWLGGRSLFVNFVPSSIYDPRVCLRTTEEAARIAGIGMEQLVFEVIETEHIRDVPHLRDIFARYHEMGARVALDDLGSGHASLAVAAELEPDVIKLDGAVVRAAPTTAEARAFITDAVRFARATDSTVLAEGIEEPAQADLARELGVDLGQGWHFGRPVPTPAPR